MRGRSLTLLAMIALAGLVPQAPAPARAETPDACSFEEGVVRQVGPSSPDAERATFGLLCPAADELAPLEQFSSLGADRPGAPEQIGPATGDPEQDTFGHRVR